MTDFNKPATSDTYTNILTYLNAKIASAAKMLYSGDTNIPTSTMTYNRTSHRLQEWSGSAWVDQTIDNLVSGSVAYTTLAAAVQALVFKPGMIVATGRAFTDTGAAVETDTGFLLCNGAEVAKVGTYAALYAAIGDGWGTAADPANNFKIPDGRGKNLLGKAASGTGSTLKASFGSLDHTHTTATHRHTDAVHAHTLNSHTHTASGTHVHTLNSHIHTGPSHTHPLTAASADLHFATDIIRFLRKTGGFTPTHRMTFGSAAITTDTTGVGEGIGLVGSTDAAGTGVTGGPSTTNTGATSDVITNGPSVPNTGNSSGTDYTGYSGALATDAQNPPELVINWQIKY